MENIFNKNLSVLDRLLRLIVAEVFFIFGFFWFGGILQVIFYIFGGILFATGIVGYCGIYNFFGFNTFKNGMQIQEFSIIFLIVIFITVGVGGYYSSIFFTKKIFLQEYNQMNAYYKQTLFNTGNGNRDESVSNYDILVKEYGKFYNKYIDYKPYSIRGDQLLNSDLEKINNIIGGLKEGIYSGDLQASHSELEKIRPIFQGLLKRNNFSLLAVALVDFHDTMEKLIEAADDKNDQLLLKIYSEADIKLKAVEEQVIDEEIVAIRNSLEDLKSLAENEELDKLANKAQELKSNFVKVYLNRG